MTVFTEEAWNNLPADPWEAVERACELYFGNKPKISQPMEPVDLQRFVEAAAFHRSLIARYKIDGTGPVLAHEQPHEFAQMVENSYSWLRGQSMGILNRRRLEAAIRRAEASFSVDGAPGPFSLDESQVAEIQGILSEIGAVLRETDELSEGHRQRALQALAALQSELDRKTTTLERLTAWAFEMEVVAARMAKSASTVMEKTEAAFAQANDLLEKINRVMLITGAAYIGSMQLPPGTEHEVVVLRQRQLALPGGHEPVAAEQLDIIDAEFRETQVGSERQ